MENDRYSAILAIAEISETEIKDARRMFFAYKEKGIILDSIFDDDTWEMCDEYARFNLKFSLDHELFIPFSKRLKISEREFINLMKTYIMCQMGNLAMVSIQHLLRGIKLAACCQEKDLEKFLEMNLEKYPDCLSEFFSLLPSENREDELENLLECFDNAREKTCFRKYGNQRTLASFESYFRFDEILKKFWNESQDMDEKLFYFPVWMWWNVSAILPMRPREFVLTPRECLKKMGEEYHLIIRKNRIKGSGKKKSYKISSDYEIQKYTIPEKLAKEIQWYIDNTKDFQENDLSTLFVTGTHYSMWERCAPYTSRYFTYTNMRTCLRYFFENIVHKRYGYRIVTEHSSFHTDNERDIEYIHLGDTRHIALINIIAEGATPVVAMMLAGHENPEMTAHYYANIGSLIECRTRRQYKKMISGEAKYELARTVIGIREDNFILLGDGSRCYSPEMTRGEYSDCHAAVGPAGEIGFCGNCPYHRSTGHKFSDSKELYKNEISITSELLEKVVNKVRSGKGDEEEILSAILRLRDAGYSYERYLLEAKEV